MRTLAEKAVVEEKGKLLPGFKYMTQAEAAQKLNDKRAAVHTRWVKMWAKRVFAAPEQALVPVKERDALLASSFAVSSSRHGSMQGRSLACSCTVEQHLWKRACGCIVMQHQGSIVTWQVLLSRCLRDDSVYL